MAVFKALAIDPDLEWEFIDGSIVKAHQHSSGAIGDYDQAIANRYDKLKRNYKSMLDLACGYLWLAL